MSGRFPSRATSDASISSWGKPAVAGIGVVEGYGVASGGTGSNITASSKSYRLLSFLSDGTLTVTVGGVFDCLLVGGGGGFGYSGAAPRGGGGGGGVIRSTYYIAPGTYSVIVAAGQGSGGSVGYASSIANVAYVGGGGGSNGHATPTGQQSGINGGGAGGFNQGSNPSCMRGITSTIYGGGFAGGGNAGGHGGAGGGGGGAGGAGTSSGGPGVDQSDFFGNAAGTNRFGGGGGSSNGSNGVGNGANNTGGGGKNDVNSGYSGSVYVRFRV